MAQSLPRGQLRPRTEKHQDGLTIPVSDWEYIKSKIAQIDVSTGLFSAFGWAVIGVAGSCIVNYLTLEDKDKPSHLNLCWLFALGFALGLLSLFYAWKTNTSAATRREDVLSEMKRIEDRFESNTSELELASQLNAIAQLLGEAISYGRQAVFGPPRASNDDIAIKELRKAMDAAEQYIQIQPDLDETSHGRILRLFRTATITISIVYEDRIRDHSQALAELSRGLQLIKQFSRDTAESKIHIAALYYNRACLRSKMTPVNASEMLADLEIAMTDPLNKKEARNDEDFRAYLNDERFLKLTT